MPTTLWKSARSRCCVCGRGTETHDIGRVNRHYINRERDEWIPVCQSCQSRIYHEDGYYDELQLPDTA